MWPIHRETQVQQRMLSPTCKSWELTRFEVLVLVEILHLEKRKFLDFGGSYIRKFENCGKLQEKVEIFSETSGYIKVNKIIDVEQKILSKRIMHGSFHLGCKNTCCHRMHFY
jgi:hypothetical protein